MIIDRITRLQEARDRDEEKLVKFNSNKIKYIPSKER